MSQPLSMNEVQGTEYVSGCICHCVPSPSLHMFHSWEYRKPKPCIMMLKYCNVDIEMMIMDISALIYWYLNSDIEIMIFRYWYIAKMTLKSCCWYIWILLLKYRYWKWYGYFDMNIETMILSYWYIENGIENIEIVIMLNWNNDIEILILKWWYIMMLEQWYWKSYIDKCT